MNQKTSNYAIQAENARAEFLKYCQDSMITRFNLRHDDRFLYVSFFQNEYGINRLTGEVLHAESSVPAGFSAVMSIYDVLCYSKVDAALSGEWKPLNSLSPHSNFGAGGKSLFGLSAKKLLGKVAELKYACAKLGGQEATKADVGYLFNAFPFLPVVFQFWDGDEEFDPRINLLFDSNTLDYIHFETAWYVAEHLLDMISDNMG